MSDMADVSTLAIFVDDSEGEVGIGLAIADASIVEMENGELVAGCKFTVGQAKLVVSEFRRRIEQIEKAA